MKIPEQRLFLAIWPDQAVRTRLEEVVERLPAHWGRLSHPLDWHLTLVFLGQVEEVRLPCIERVAAGISSSPLMLSVDKVGYWRRPRILWCGASEAPETLSRLVTDLQDGLRDCGFKPESRPYAPHVTLARKARPVEGFALDVPIRWQAREFVLAASVGGAKPPRYQILKHWKLA